MSGVQLVRKEIVRFATTLKGEEDLDTAVRDTLNFLRATYKALGCVNEEMEICRRALEGKKRLTKKCFRALRRTTDQRNVLYQGCFIPGPN